MLLPESLFPFELYTLEDTFPVWINTSTVNSILGANLDLNGLNRYFSKVSLCESSSKLFKERLNLNDKTTAFAEIYGGAGISTHAGGARSGIVSGILAKGIGLNPLRGDDVKATHSTGALCLIDALVEAIYSHLTNAMTPRGSVETLGIIYTGENTAFSSHVNQRDFDLDHGAILLRRAAMRPASFLPTPWYKPSSFKIPVNDCQRLHKLFRHVFTQQHEDVKKFANWLCSFCFSCADQFAYSLVNGLMHGGLSFSNYALSGQWLDLTLTTYVDNHRNYAIADTLGIPTFHNEHKFPLGLIDIFLWEANKYLDINLNAQKVLDLYDREFRDRRSYYIDSHIGVDLYQDSLSVHEVASIKKSFNGIVVGSPSIIFASPNFPPEHDAELDFFIELYKKVILANPSSLKLRVFFIGKIRSHLFKRVFYRARIIEELRGQLYSVPANINQINETLLQYFDIVNYALKGELDSNNLLLLVKTDNILIHWGEEGLLLDRKPISHFSLLNYLSSAKIESNIDLKDIITDLLISIRRMTSP